MMMDRLQKKCILASTAFHTLLVGLLLFGSALMPKPEETPAVPLKFYRSADVSAALSSGGSPDVVPAPAPPTPAPTAPTPPPQVELPKPKPAEPIVKPLPDLPKVVHRDVPKEHDIPKLEIPKTDKPTKLPKEPVADRPKTPHVIEIDPASLKQVKRTSGEKADAEQAAADARARARQKQIAANFASAYKSIGSRISSSTPVELPPGIGGPGPVSVNYGSIISSKYFDAWRPPTDVDEALATAEASVNIAKDGSVISARITKSSGNASLDRSIENALNAVKFIEPFPASFKQEQMTVTVPFNLQTKRQTG